MCRPTTCRTCGKTTWAGCGQHVAQVRAQVPAGDWCPGHAKAPRSSASGDGEQRASGGFLARVLGRR